MFPGDDGKVLRDEVVNSEMANVCEAADMRRIHSHVLRHTFASHAVMRGIMYGC